MINVIQIGLGPIGKQITRFITDRKGLSIVAAIDSDSRKTGKDLGEHAGMEKVGVPIVEDIDSAEGADRADIAIISTVSSLEGVEGHLREAAGRGLDIISTCEELAYPWRTQPERASRIDHYCKEHEVSCLGTGVNPGFMMDYLPSVITSVCSDVDFIKVERFQDAAPRRKSFRDKIGVGLSARQFEKKRDEIAHVGLIESVHMIGDAMNFSLNKVDESLEPVWAKEPVQNDRIRIKQGEVAGVQQMAHGYCDDKTCIELIFLAAVGLEDPRDTIEIVGNPDFTSTIEGGINGDITTASLIVNTIRSVQQSEPGLNTMLDIAAPTYFEYI